MVLLIFDHRLKKPGNSQNKLLPGNWQTNITKNKLSGQARSECKDKEFFKKLTIVSYYIRQSHTMKVQEEIKN
jgi:hypothetical protein